MVSSTVVKYTIILSNKLHSFSQFSNKIYDHSTACNSFSVSPREFYHNDTMKQAKSSIFTILIIL
jgi:hypothetical protein